MKTINSFILEKLKITKHMLNNQRDGYEYVDLGLQSGTLWAIRYTSGGKDLFFGVDDAYEMHDGDCLVLQGVDGNEID